MSKQLQKLNYAPEEVEISVIGSSTPTTGSLTITQIKTLLASDQNYIKYTITASASEYLYFTNFTNNTAFYGADLYNATTSVYYRHLIKISYSSDLSSATWNYYNIPIITGSSSDLQEKLVSGTNIKTINNNSLLGSGNLAINEFPERSEVDAALSQIAGLNSNGLPDVGKVAAANMDSGSATAGQVLTADGSGNAAWQPVIPSVVIALSQIVSQDPLEVQLTDAQYNIFANNKQVVLDLSALGQPTVVWQLQIDESSYMCFGFVSASSGTTLDSNLIDINKSTKVVTYYNNTIGETADITKSVEVITTAPSSANTSGLKFVVLSSEPATRYNGYIYFITGSN